MLEYRWKLTERYPNGGKWEHFFFTREAAEISLKALMDAHKSRVYELVELTEHRLCEHGYHHPSWPHSCDGCWCEGERDRRDYGWQHDTSPKKSN